MAKYIRILTSMGYAGTDDEEYLRVPDDIADDPEKLQEWIAENEKGAWDALAEMVSASVELVDPEDVPEEYLDDEDLPDEED